MRAFLTAAFASIRGLPLLRLRPRRRGEAFLKSPLLWHLRFGGADMERLVAGRERIYLDRFWNEFSALPDRFSEVARRHALLPVFTMFLVTFAARAGLTLPAAGRQIELK